MTVKKVIYFTKANLPTAAELLEIAGITAGNFALLIRPASNVAALKYGERREPCDYVAGSAPSLYADVSKWQAGVELTPTQAIITDGDTIDVDGKPYKAIVTNGSLTGMTEVV